ncbi:Rhodanese-related sulfurtransferase [Mycolicibacterium rhodesiae NBB3]|uniref:Rhodanese-related sulfurtransferase n=1 Tax=Mycolicibacterium rhodesiae (strain NBB3) TaxID=710685 RepID=G8RKL5_MYCRN|nr:rhodanese-like domain-containing protein [Mycolicibacterium rhodesiae]AEV74806.1 Rhodanese-related sulfurtransferase [Mycolicibacterium rhodesiae NBB3]
MPTAHTDTVSSTDLRNLLDSTEPTQIVDVRTPAEFESAHIPGSFNLPLDILRSHKSDVVKNLEDDVVLVCRSGQRSTQAQQILNSAGTAARVLQDGIVDWEERGYDVNRGKQRWDLERQVRLVAGSIVFSSVVGSVFVPKAKWLAAAIGGGLTYAAVSNTCAMATALSKLPYNRGAETDAAKLVSKLTSTPGPPASSINSR